MSRSDGTRRGSHLLLWSAVAVSLAGVTLLVVGLRAQVSAPQPHDAGRIRAAAPSSHAPRITGPGPDRPLGPSRPVRIRIPAIGVDSPVHPIGLDPDGSLAVPQPGPRLNHAAWFRHSPTPGQPGPSIIEGHVDSVEGPSVFFRLGAIGPGDRIRVDRADGSRLVFEVNAVRDFLKADFPTKLVYGGQPGTPTLRLITCSDFDPSIRHHIGNEVVFSHLVRVVRHPRKS